LFAVPAGGISVILYYIISYYTISYYTISYHIISKCSPYNLLLQAGHTAVELEKYLEKPLTQLHVYRELLSVCIALTCHVGPITRCIWGRYPIRWGTV